MDGEDNMEKEELQENYDGSCIQQAIRGRGEPAVNSMDGILLIPLVTLA